LKKARKNFCSWGHWHGMIQSPKEQELFGYFFQKSNVFLRRRRQNYPAVATSLGFPAACIVDRLSRI
jgi:hypothetical protein